MLSVWGMGKKEEQNEENKCKINLEAEGGPCAQHNQLVTVSPLQKSEQEVRRDVKQSCKLPDFIFLNLPIISQIFLVLPLAQHLSTAEKLA